MDRALQRPAESFRDGIIDAVPQDVVPIRDLPEIDVPPPQTEPVGPRIDSDRHHDAIGPVVGTDHMLAVVRRQQICRRPR